MTNTEPSWRVAAMREEWRAELARRKGSAAQETQPEGRENQRWESNTALIEAVDHALDTSSEPSPAGMVPVVLERLGRLSKSDRDAAYWQAVRVYIEARIYERQGDALPVQVETKKVRENRLRRIAARQGLTLRKSPRRDARAIGYGTYMLIDSKTRAVVDAGSADGYGLDLNAIECKLTGSLVMVRDR
jgi:hypothetical protein